MRFRKVSNKYYLQLIVKTSKLGGGGQGKEYTAYTCALLHRASPTRVLSTSTVNSNTGESGAATSTHSFVMWSRVPDEPTSRHLAKPSWRTRDFRNILSRCVCLSVSLSVLVFTSLNYSLWASTSIILNKTTCDTHLKQWLAVLVAFSSQARILAKGSTPFHSLPALFSFCKWRLARAYLFHSLG